MLSSYASIEEIIQALQQKEVVAYPTEAVYGLGCDPDERQAVQRLLELKQRSWQKGMILIAADYQQLSPYIAENLLTETLLKHIQSTWPGHITWVMPARPTVPAWLKGDSDGIAVRISPHPLVQRLCRAYGKALVSTSANRARKKPCYTAEEVRAQFGTSILILEGKVGGLKNPSEIRHALSGKTLRKG